MKKPYSFLFVLLVAWGGIQVSVFSGALSGGRIPSAPVSYPLPSSHVALPQPAISLPQYSAAPALTLFSDSLRCHYDHSYSPTQLVAPGLLLTTGYVVSANPYLHTHVDGCIRDRVQSFRQEHNVFATHYEDYFQYLPLASVFALKACGLESRHGWRDLVCLTAGSCLIGFGINRTLKAFCSVERPDGRNFSSFPSGHSTTAFLGAELLRREYGEEYPAVAVAGYAVAAGVACSRVWHNRHWASDLFGGAGFSILSVALTYWLSPYLRF